MALSEKAQIYFNVWCCAHQRRHNAKVVEDWDLYLREQETVLMSLKMKGAKWTKWTGE
jgi:hypothetical protein